MMNISDSSTEATKSFELYQNENTDSIVENDIDKERKKYITRGTSGLVNIGNTCYMNSAIQLMAATDQLVSYFRGDGKIKNARYKDDLRRGVSRIIVEKEKKKYGEEKEQYIININKMRQKFKDSLTYKLRNLICVMWGYNRKIKPYSFKQKLGEINSEFAGNNQNDSQECLSLVLDTIHEETKSEIELLMKPLDPSMEMVRQTKMKFATLKNKKAQQEYIKYKNQHLSQIAKIEALEYWKTYLSKNNSMIEHIFGGLFFSTIKCSQCENSNFNFDPFRIINLHVVVGQDDREKMKNMLRMFNEFDTSRLNQEQMINFKRVRQMKYIEHIKNMEEKDVTIEECLKNYFGDEEKLEGDCQYFCNICNCKTDATKKTQIWYCPQRLIIHFKRFDNGMRKNNKKIVFPINGLNMTEYMSEYVEGECIYDLYGISYHSGNIGGGHYTAYTKNPINKMWYYYDDSNVLHIEESEIESKLINNGAYVLMYQARREFVSIMPDSSNDEFENLQDLEEI